MRNKITQEMFEEAFWLYRGGIYHNYLCLVFIELKCIDEFQKFWKEINFRKQAFAYRYLAEKPAYHNLHSVPMEAIAIWRIMIAQEFIKQFNEKVEK